MFEVIGLVALHFLGWYTVIRMRENTLGWSDYKQDERAVGHVLFGFFWPAYLPVLTVWALGTKKLSFPRIRLPKRGSIKDSEILPGVERPSRIVAQMIAARVIKNYSGLGYERWSDKDIQLCWSERNKNISSLYSVGIKGKDFPVDAKDESIIHDAINKAKKLKAEKDALAEQTKREETALSIIETLTLGDSD